MINAIGIYNDDIGEVSLIDWMGDDRRAALAARASFLEDLDGLASAEKLSIRDKKLLTFMIKEKHTSPFEHSTITFRIKCPLYIRSQIMRHRTFSYNEVSRRYTSNCIEFHIPQRFRAQSKRNLQCSTGGEVDHNDSLVAWYTEQTNKAYQAYKLLLDSGVCREQARAILPQNLYSTFWMTGSLHNYIKFLKLRLDAHAQPEVQEVAKAMCLHMQDIFPETLEIFYGLGILVEG